MAVMAAGISGAGPDRIVFQYQPWSILRVIGRERLSRRGLLSLHMLNRVLDNRNGREVCRMTVGSYFWKDRLGRRFSGWRFPIILGNVLQTGYQLTDAFWVGRLGGAAVAAVAVSFPITFLVIALGAGLAIAGATLSAQYMGAGRQDMVNHVAAQTMLMVAITSVFMGAAGYVLSPYLLELIGVAPDVYHGALGFMRVSFIGIIFVFLYGMFQALMRGVGETRMPLIIVLGTVILNFLFDPLFIFGWGWFPGQGVMGAALATLATQGLAAVLGMVIFLRGRHGIQLGWRDFRPDPQYIKRAFFLGLPGSIELSTRGLGPLLMTFLVTGFGTVTLAAYGIGSNILQFIVIPAMGLSMAVSTLVSQNIGAGNIQGPPALRCLARLGFHHSHSSRPDGLPFRSPLWSLSLSRAIPQLLPRARASFA